MVEIKSNRPQAGSICPLCEKHGRSILDFSRLFHGYSFSLHKCESCSLCYTFPPPADEILEKIYSGEYWIREAVASREGYFARLVQKFNEARLAATVKPLLCRLSESASVLEVGCGSGHLAAYLKQRGFDIEVTDIDQKLLDEIKNVHRVSGYRGSLEDIKFAKTYDAVLFNNVLEHLPDPLKTLRRAEQLLNPGCCIFIEVPNIDSFQFKIFKESWFPLQIPQHLYHFSPETINSISLKANLEKVWCSTFSPRISSS